jgi:hypothetical protein
LLQLGLTCSNQAGITNLDNLDNINTNFDNLDVVIIDDFVIDIIDDFVIDIISHVSHTSKLATQVSRISATSLDSLDDFARLANTSRANANHIHPLRGVYTTNSASFDTANTGHIELGRASIGHEGHIEHENYDEFDGDYGHIEPDFASDDYN